MADVPSEQVEIQPHPSGLDPNSLQYWCYHCNKRVSIETSADLPDIICHECKNGFVESIDSHQPPLHSGVSDPIDDAISGNQFLQMLRLIAQTARDADARTPPTPPPPHLSGHADPSDDDYLRIELDGWDNDDEDDEDDDEDDDDDDDDDEEDHDHVHDHNDGVSGNPSVARNEDAENRGRENENRDRSVDEEEEEEEEEGEGDEENENRHGGYQDAQQGRQGEVLRNRLMEFATRTAIRHNRVLDWAEILLGLEDHAIELRFAVPGGDRYIGNPGDYLDAAGYEALLQTLAENDSGGRSGPPPASKDAIEALETLEIKDECDALACAVCKDVVSVGEMAKKLPCSHVYHGDCIIPWLGSRNSCPVCRYELPTDDPDYEEEKKKRAGPGATVASTSGGSHVGGDT